MQIHHQFIQLCMSKLLPIAYEVQPYVSRVQQGPLDWMPTAGGDFVSHSKLPPMTSVIDPKGISPLLACRLIALDKCPGVRPIGVCETHRRIIAKAVLYITRSDLQDAAGPRQLCAGQIAGIEAAAHGMRSLFSCDDTEAVLLVDATNAFNSLNRQAALRNIQHLCPSLSNILINTYREPTELFVDDQVLWSEEGTTQGDPLAMQIGRAHV